MDTVLQFIKGGGLMMYPLIAASVLLVALMIERFITLRKASADGDDLLDDIKANYPAQADEALQLVEKHGALGRVLARGLRNSSRNADAIEMAMEQEAANEVPSLEANLPIIKTIVNIAPLLG